MNKDKKSIYRAIVDKYNSSKVSTKVICIVSTLNMKMWEVLNET